MGADITGAAAEEDMQFGLLLGARAATLTN